MDDAKATIRQTLSQVKAYLAQESPPNLTEADTKAHFIEPIVAALGWTGIGVVTREYYVKNSQEFIDFVMRGASEPLLAIEAKALQTSLTDKHAAQLIQYCSVEGIEWAALTNGRELQFFNTFLKPDLAAKRVLSLDLLAFNSDEEYDALFQQIWQLSHQSMTTPTGVRTWLNQRRLDTALRGILLNSGSPAVKQLRKTLTAAEIRATPQDIVQWFRSHLGTPITALPHPSQRRTTPSRVQERMASSSSSALPSRSSTQESDTVFDPSRSVVFRGEHQRLLPLFHAFRALVDERVPTAKWRALKYYVAAEVEGQTFLAVKRRGQGLVIGMTLPPETSGSSLTDNQGEFNWARITKVRRISHEGDIDESLHALVDTSRSHALIATRGSTYYGVTLRDLLDAQVIAPNERLVLSKSGQDVATATLSADGAIEWQGQSYFTPSDRVFARLLGRQSLNGWTTWHVERPTGRQSLAELRASLQAPSSHPAVSNDS